METVKPSFMRTLSTETKAKAKISFLDDEYPALGGNANRQTPRSSKKKSLEAESASEWETEAEEDDCSTQLPTLDDPSDFVLKLKKGRGLSPKVTVLPRDPKPTEVTEEVKKDVVGVENAGPKQWADLVKSGRPKSDHKQLMKPVADALKQPKEVGSSTATVVSKKVKRKDPITFDIFAAVKANSKENDKKRKAAGSKTTVAAVRNALDSVPVKVRRGKERLTPKKKRPTTMRKIILADRLLRQQLRLCEQAMIESKDCQPPKAGIESETQLNVDSHPVDQPDISRDNQAKLVCGSVNSISDKDQLKDISSKTMAPGEDPGDKAPMLHDCSSSSLVDPPASDRVFEQAPSDEKSLVQIAKGKFHSRKFGRYCNHVMSKDMDRLVNELMSDLVRLQDKKHAEDPEKAKAKRRYVLGLREASKFLKVNKAAAIIFAADIEPVTKAGGLNDAVADIIDSASLVDDDGVLVRSVPIFFVLNR